MGEEKLLNQVQKTVSEYLNVPLEDVRPESSFVDLGADSMDRLDLLLGLEEALNIDIPDDDAKHLMTVQSVVDYVNQRSQRI